LKIKQVKNSKICIILLCLVGVIAVYLHDLALLWDDALRNEMASYILALPFLVSYIIYQKRDLLRAQLSIETEKPQNIVMKDVIGVSLCLSALFLHIHGSFTFNTLEYHLISLVVFIAGCAVILAGIKNLRNLIIPLGFLVLTIIPYREEAYRVATRLSTLTSTITYNILRLLNYPVTPTQFYEAPSIMITTPTGEQVPFAIDIPCAGAYSLIGFIVFILFFIHVSTGNPKRKIPWLLGGFLLVYLANIARIILILTIAYRVGAETAIQIFHIISGPILLFATTLLIILIGEKALGIKIFESVEHAKEACSLCQENRSREEVFCTYCGRLLDSSRIRPSKADVGKVLVLALLGVIILNIPSSAMTSGQQHLLVLNIDNPATNQENNGFLPQIDGYDLGFIYRDRVFEGFAGQDAALLYAYYPKNMSQAPIFVTAEIGDSYSKLHRWEICLYIVPSEQGGQATVSPISSRDVQIVENPSLVGRFFQYRYVNSGQNIMILYWYQRSTIRIGESWENKYIKTSLIAYVDSFIRTGEVSDPSDYAKLEVRLLSMARAITDQWLPATTWSAFLVAFAYRGQSLALATVAIASFVAIILFLTRRRKEEREAEISQKRLGWYSISSGEERVVLEIIKTLREKGESTILELSNVYESRKGESVVPQELLRIMRRAEESHLVAKALVVTDGQLFLAWRSLI